MGFIPEPETTVAGTLAVVGPTAVVAAPGANQRLVVSLIRLQAEDATPTAGVVVIASGATTNGLRLYADAAGDAVEVQFGRGREWRLNENEALNVTLPAAGETYGYTVMYHAEQVFTP
jgi:hypothetical protein